jgi:hypothetical protein
MRILSEKTIDETSVRTPLMCPLIDFEGVGNGDGKADAAMGMVAVAMVLAVLPGQHWQCGGSNWRVDWGKASKIRDGGSKHDASSVDGPVAFQVVIESMEC